MANLQRPISNRPARDMAQAWEGRFEIGLQDRILPHCAHFERRCTMTLFTEFIRATAFGRESIAFSTIGSVSTVMRRASSTPNAVMYISRLRNRLIQSLFSLNSFSENR